MKIQLKNPASAGGITIPPGEYMVALLTESREINLAGGGHDYRVPAKKRPNKRPVKVLDVQFYSLGGTSWTILVKTPKQGEWMGQLQIEKKLSFQK